MNTNEKSKLRVIKRYVDFVRKHKDNTPKKSVDKYLDIASSKISNLLK